MAINVSKWGRDQSTVGTNCPVRMLKIKMSADNGQNWLTQVYQRLRSSAYGAI